MVTFAPPGSEFYFKSEDHMIEGVARSVDDLRSIAERLDPQALCFHIRNDHNDFESWIRSILSNHELADRISLIKDARASTADIKRNLLATLSRKRVFIVDDDPGIRAILEEALTCEGYCVVGSASDGAEAVRGIEGLQKKPNVVIMDYELPSMDGIEATRHIRRTCGDPEVIMISGNRAIARNALDAGASVFLPKPFNVKELVGAVERCARGHELIYRPSRAVSYLYIVSRDR